MVYSWKNKKDMEENPTLGEQHSQNSSQQPVTQIIHHKSNNTLLVLIIVFLLLVIVGGAAYYFGLMKKPTPENVTANTTPTVTQQQETEAITPTTAPVVNLTKYTNPKMKDLSFPSFSLSYPEGWVKTDEKSDIMQSVTFTKGAYVIKINQGPMGGNICIFEGEMPEGPASDYRNTKYVEIDASEILLRRLVTDGQKGTTVTHSFCSNSTNSKTLFGIPTMFGVITYTTPSTPDAKTLEEMDEIIKSLQAL